MRRVHNNAWLSARAPMAAIAAAVGALAMMVPASVPAMAEETTTDSLLAGAVSAPACNTSEGSVGTICSTKFGNTEVAALKKFAADSNITTVYFKNTDSSWVTNDYIDFSDNAGNAPLAITHNLTLVGARTKKSGSEPADVSRILDISFHVQNGAKLTLAGNLVVDDAEPSISRAEIPVVVENGSFATRDTVRLMSNNGTGTAAGVYVNADAPQGTVELDSDGTFTKTDGFVEARGTYPTVYGTSGAVINESPNVAVTISNGTYVSEAGDEYEGEPAHAVYSKGTLTVNGQAKISSIRVAGGVANINGGNINSEYADQFEETPSTAQYPLRIDNGAKVYMTSGAIAKNNNTAIPNAVSIAKGGFLFVRAAEGDETYDPTPTIDGTKLSVGAFDAKQPQNGPELSLNYAPINGITNNKVALRSNYQLTDEAAKSFEGQVAADMLFESDYSGNNTRDVSTITMAGVTTTQANGISTASTSYADKHGVYYAYGRYQLTGNGVQSTLIGGDGDAFVYGNPTKLEYEWYSKDQVKAYKDDKTGNVGKSYPVNEGINKNRLFAGWFSSYTDWNKSATADYKNDTYTSGANAKEYAWAHFADSRNLTLRAQTTASKDGKKAVRLLTTVDSTKYATVNFTINASSGKSVTGKTTTAYAYVLEKDNQVKPNVRSEFGAFNSPEADNSEVGKCNGYWATMLVRNVPEGTTTIPVTLSWTTLDGTTVTVPQQNANVQ